MQQFTPLSCGIVSGGCVDMSVPNPFGHMPSATVVKWSDALSATEISSMLSTSGGTYAQQTLYDAVPDASLETHKLFDNNDDLCSDAQKAVLPTAPGQTRAASGSKPTFGSRPTVCAHGDFPSGSPIAWELWEWEDGTGWRGPSDLPVNTPHRVAADQPPNYVTPYAEPCDNWLYYSYFKFVGRPPPPSPPPPPQPPPRPPVVYTLYAFVFTVPAGQTSVQVQQVRPKFTDTNGLIFSHVHTRFSTTSPLRGWSTTPFDATVAANFPQAVLDYTAQLENNGLDYSAQGVYGLFNEDEDPPECFYLDWSCATNPRCDPGLAATLSSDTSKVGVLLEVDQSLTMTHWSITAPAALDMAPREVAVYKWDNAAQAFADRWARRTRPSCCRRRQPHATSTLTIEPCVHLQCTTAPSIRKSTTAARATATSRASESTAGATATDATADALAPALATADAAAAHAAAAHATPACTAAVVTRLYTTGPAARNAGGRRRAQQLLPGVGYVEERPLLHLRHNGGGVSAAHSRPDTC